MAYCLSATLTWGGGLYEEGGKWLEVLLACPSWNETTLQTLQTKQWSLFLLRIVLCPRSKFHFINEGYSEEDPISWWHSLGTLLFALGMWKQGEKPWYPVYLWEAISHLHSALDCTSLKWNLHLTKMGMGDGMGWVQIQHGLTFLLNFSRYYRMDVSWLNTLWASSSGCINNFIRFFGE